MQSVDLHGIRHSEVPDIIIECCAMYDTPFVVITGNSNRMKRIVRDTAAQFNLKVKDAINNPGRVVISESR